MITRELVVGFLADLTDEERRDLDRDVQAIRFSKAAETRRAEARDLLRRVDEFFAAAGHSLRAVRVGGLLEHPDRAYVSAVLRGKRARHLLLVREYGGELSLVTACRLETVYLKHARVGYVSSLAACSGCLDARPRQKPGSWWRAPARREEALTAFCPPGLQL